MTSLLSLVDLRGMGRTRHRDGSVTVYVPGPVYNALVAAVEAGLRVADHPFGQIDSRDFYRLREAVAPWRRDA